MCRIVAPRTRLSGAASPERSAACQAFGATLVEPHIWEGRGPGTIPASGTLDAISDAVASVGGAVAPSVVGNILDERFGICVRTGLHCAPGAHALYGQPEGGVRISPGWFTTQDEITTLIAALREMADELVKPAAIKGESREAAGIR